MIVDSNVQGKILPHKGRVHVVLQGITLREDLCDQCMSKGHRITSATEIRDTVSTNCYKPVILRKAPQTRRPVACIPHIPAFLKSNRRYPETMARSKDLSLDEISKLLREISENESDNGELSCSKLVSNEDIRVSESECEESEGNHT
ncbi:hypothetical protein TNCV_4003041 [Trichonephila clavipes]|nr:hypothetical protein TNCV_4003041 [Trichonephila clavipes]